MNRVERVASHFANVGPRLRELAESLPADVVEALALDLESRWASMDVILAAYEGLPFDREVQEVHHAPVTWPPFTAAAGKERHR